MENRKSISYSFEDIKRYRQGLMSRDEMHAFEKASMEDPFLSDALEGYMEADMHVADEHLNNISDRVQQKEEKKEQAVVVSMPKRGFAMWRVAAMVIVIAGAGLITYKILDKDKIDTGTNPGTIAKVEPTETKPTEVPQSSNISDSSSFASPATKESAKSENTTSSNWSEADAKKSAEQKQSTAALRADDLKEEAIKDEIAVRSEKKNNSNAKLEEVRPAAPAKDADPTDVGKRMEANSNLRANEIRGTIVTPSNTPLANTRFKVDNQKRAFTTDRQGNFVVVAEDSVVNATITSGYYANTTVQLRANTNNSINIGTITMKPDEEFEKTVAIVGLGSKKMRVTDSASNKPANGWDSFQDYVAKALGRKLDSTEYDSDNSTEIEFFVDTNGKPRDIKIVTSTDADEGRTKEIVEAVKKGPKWVNKNQKTRLLIRY